eukprot:TRINITY_DN1255_c1_g1_i10.p2 TRINITY_DN1255_c1_g1~~TRINITY_DN1255_c1_g1_i10.p2  ORF type:complete len:110 (+),score=4.65 TRINITY_DN1255_c1_g1_i10:166-495(+)
MAAKAWVRAVLRLWSPVAYWDRQLRGKSDTVQEKKLIVAHNTPWRKKRRKRLWSVVEVRRTAVGVAPAERAVVRVAAHASQHIEAHTNCTPAPQATRSTASVIFLRGVV